MKFKKLNWLLEYLQENEFFSKRIVYIDLKDCDYIFIIFKNCYRMIYVILILGVYQLKQVDLVNYGKLMGLSIDICKF